MYFWMGEFWLLLLLCAYSRYYDLGVEGGVCEEGTELTVLCWRHAK